MMLLIIMALFSIQITLVRSYKQIDNTIINFYHANSDDNYEPCNVTLV